MKRTRITRRANGGRRGYTLTEVLMSTVLTSVIMSQVMAALLSAQRIFETTFADVELSLQSRALREKLLYRINGDGGLMNARQTGLSLVDNNANKGSGICFTAAGGQPNTVKLNDTRKLVAGQALEDRWLECGTLVLQGTNVFGLQTTNGMIEVTLDVALPVANRKYEQRNLFQAQIMNE